MCETFQRDLPAGQPEASRSKNLEMEVDIDGVNSQVQLQPVTPVREGSPFHAHTSEECS